MAKRGESTPDGGTSGIEFDEDIDVIFDVPPIGPEDPAPPASTDPVVEPVDATTAPPAPAPAAAAPGSPLDRAVVDLDRWAAENGVGDDPGVAALRFDLAQRRDLSLWATTDLDAVLPVPPERASERWRRLATAVTAIRNVSVFVPVAITWWAINLATGAFGTYAEALGDGEEASFLRFWQSGLGPQGEVLLAEAWRIQDVARLDALIIIGIILLTVLVGLLGARARAIAVSEGGRLERERLALLLQLRGALHGYRQMTPTSIEEALAEALGELVEATRRLGTSAERLETATTGADALNVHLSAVTNALDALDGRFKGGMLGSIDGFTSAVERLGRVVADDYGRLLGEAVRNLEELGQQLAQTSASVEVGTLALREDLDAIASRMLDVARGASDRAPARDWPAPAPARPSPAPAPVSPAPYVPPAPMPAPDRGSLGDSRDRGGQSAAPVRPTSEPWDEPPRSAEPTERPGGTERTDRWEPS